METTTLNPSEKIIPLCFETEQSWSIAYLVRGENDKYIMVDVVSPVGTETWEDQLALKIKVAGVQIRHIALIIITHAHVDHYGSLAAFKRRYDVRAPVLCHRLDAEYMRRGESAPIRAWENNERGDLARRLVDTLPMRGFAAYAPEILVSTGRNDAIDFDLDSYGLPGSYLLHTPGHTQGSLSLILAGDQEALVGDLLFACKETGRRTPLIHLFAQDARATVMNIRALLERGIERFYGGHGGCWSSEQVKRMLDCLPQIES